MSAAARPTPTAVAEGQVAATNAGRRPGGIEDYESAPYVIKQEIGSVRLPSSDPLGEEMTRC